MYLHQTWRRDGVAAWEELVQFCKNQDKGAGVSFITVAYAQNKAWNVRTPLLTQTLGFIKTNLTGKFAYFHANSDPCVRTFWRRESGKADVRWWTEARLLIQFIIYIITNSLVLLARHICLKIYYNLQQITFRFHLTAELRSRVINRF